MSNFGEMNYGSSCAMADDEEDEYPSQDKNPKYQDGLIIEWTEEGNNYLKANVKAKNAHTFCAFVGKVGLGFGEGFINKKESEAMTLLGQIFVIGNDGTVDLCARRPKRTPKVRIYLGRKGTSHPVVFALIDFYAVPRVFSGEVASKMDSLLKISSEVVIFYSGVSAYYRGDAVNLEGRLWYLSNMQFNVKCKSTGSAARLPPPNLISGPAAAILTRCVCIKMPVLMLITYWETELVDSISMKPFFDGIKEWKSEKPEGLSLAKIFAPFQHNLQAVLKSDFVSVGNSSNLYV